MSNPSDTYIIKLSCPDQPGIVQAVSSVIFECGGNIVDSAQFGDARTQRFFLRTQFSLTISDPALSADLRARFAQVAERFDMQWEIADASRKPRVLLMVSKIGHCLNDLLFRYRTGQLNVEIPAIVSNHKDFYQLAASYDIPFHYLPLMNATAESKSAQEAKVWEVVQQERIDLVVLARYMQILSPDLCEKLAGRAINIHHSFLPSFKGAKPYYQAYERGVKLIGATAHYVTTDLDEGPIIEQVVERVDHAMDPESLTMAGRDAECVALSRAVKWHLEQRVIISGHRTVVFR
ncbi:formyltetrahydrofolate deformylase [Paraburkholderia sp. J63]|uniref:formyltetrahydrofolate deformylase n=1 Tax=Paraburkholderia sp. J63 TaxID=2805434 RepID=UPI002ABDF4DB|nr:formyltetrahydrofolate deformylase [Paraburkholderia sp. J63]